MDPLSGDPPESPLPPSPPSAPPAEPEPTPAEEAPEAGALRNEDGLQLALRFYKLFRISAMHSWNNQATFGPLADLTESVAKLTRGRGSVTLLAYDNNLFLNRTRLRFGSQTYDLGQRFYEILLERGVGGLTFIEGIPQDELRGLVASFSRFDRSDKRPFHAIQEEMRTHGIRFVQIHTPKTLRHLHLKAAHVDQRTFVILTYAKAVRVLKDYARCVGKPEMAFPTAIRAQRVVQDLVDIGAQEGDRFLALTSIKSLGDYVFHHSVNVAILSILMGVRLGLNKGQVGDLGMAALFHDVGKLVIAGEQGGAGGAQLDAGKMRRHPFLAFEHLANLGQVNGSLLRRIAVAVECNIRSSGYPALQISRDPYLFSRVVSIANSFDALTTPRPGRPALLPDRALQVLWESRGERYDAALLKVFIQIVGLIPLGTLVRLDTGELALVTHNRRDPSKIGRPRVKLVMDEREIPRDGPVVDLGDRDGPEGPWRRSIVAIENPLTHGLDVPRSMLSSNAASDE